MPCKLDHDDPDSLPRFLCAVCNPRERKAAHPVECAAAAPAAPNPEYAAKYARRRKRRLRAEVKALADELEKFRIARVGKDMIEAAESKWRSAYAELALMED